MSTYPFTTPRSYSTGDVVSAADMNTHWRDNVGFLWDRPAVRVTRTTAVSMITGSAMGLAWEAEEFDTDSMWNAGGSASDKELLHVNTAGVYLVQLQFGWAANTAGDRHAQIKHSTGGTVAYWTYPPPSGGAVTAFCNLSCLYRAAAGTSFLIETFQDSGSNLNTVAPLSFSACWQAKY